MSVREPADFEWDKAEAQLAEAAAQDPARTPMAMAHSAYYAGFHAALAVLLLRSKSAPKKHGIVVQQFGLLARSGSEELRQAGRDLHKLKDLRHQADYETGRILTAHEASAAARMARAFMEVCAREFGFPRAYGNNDG